MNNELRWYADRGKSNSTNDWAQACSREKS